MVLSVHPIIDGVYREILMGLRQYAIESTAHIILNVVAGYDDIYFALGGEMGGNVCCGRLGLYLLMIFARCGKLSRHCQKRVTLDSGRRVSSA